MQHKKNQVQNFEYRMGDVREKAVKAAGRGSLITFLSLLVVVVVAASGPLPAWVPVARLRTLLGI
ncbi:hypothetical protein ABZ470_28025 [Streptosporangium sp. NPDC020072]|uniref:hypothetical protein n=1 Tax=Streptosporangium sp. NPDC020072 TaxID=3154788 RepID=UPI0034298449